MKKLTISLGILMCVFLLFKEWHRSDNSTANLVSEHEFEPSVEYLLDKRGAPYEELLQYREKQFDAIRKQNSFRSNPDFFPGKWDVQGPGNIGARITAVTINPKDEKIIYAGFSEGGLFKTIDAGKNWMPIFDDQAMLSIGCIAIDPKSPNIIYVGTGDPNNGGSITAGNGVYKSVDGGLTWKVSGLQLCRNISKIIVDAQNPSILIVAALGNPFDLNEHRGLYKSKDGGLTWNKTLFVNNGVGFIDLIVDPSDPNIMYSSSYDRWLTNSGYAYGGPNAAVYKTTDGGDSWKKLKDALPAGKWGRVNLAISAKNPSVVYLSYIKYDTTNITGGYDLGGVRISSNKGLTWKETGTLDPSSGLDPDCLRGFGWYFGRVITNPRNENDLFLLGVELWRSFDRGEHWIQASPDWRTYEVHADKHDIAFLADGSFILGTDGGLYKTDELISKWEDIENIPCTQFYRVTYLPQNPDEYFGGAQDNGTMFGNKSGLNDWQSLCGGDGFQLQSRKKDPNQLFAETQNGNIWDLITWENMSDSLPGTKNWDMPYYLSYHNDEKLVAGTDHVYEKIGFGTNPWIEISNQLTSGGRFTSRKTPTITTLDESHIDQNIIIAGTTNGLIWLRDKANQYDWKDISSNLPPGYITSVKTSNTNKNIFYVTMSTKQKNDYSPFVYKSINSGQSWVALQSNLPMFPIYDVFVYPNRRDSILFVATDIGVYASINSGSSWQRLGENMPFIPVFDLDLNISNNHLIAGTFARSIQSFSLDKLLKQNPVSTKHVADLDDILVYPNPCIDHLNIIMNRNNDKVEEGILIDVNGNKIKYFNIGNEFKISLDMSNIQEGIYFIIVKGRKPLRMVKVNE